MMASALQQRDDAEGLLAFARSLRVELVELIVDGLIDHLDALQGDPDFEEDEPAEDDGDAEIEGRGWVDGNW